MKILLICITFLATIGTTCAHGSTVYNQNPVDTHNTKIDSSQQQIGVDHPIEGINAGESQVTAALSDFPSLHPLIVHFAIVLIIIAAGLQLVNLWLRKMEIGWITTAILFGGVATALLAAKLFHPHTHGLSAHAQLVLDQHDLWADWTIYTAILTLVLQLSGQFLFKGKKWISILAAVVLIVSAYSVSRAGHYGSQLVHLEGVGPQGKFLELEHE